MKKLIYLFIALIGLGFASCKKCQTCTDCNLGAGNGEYCEKDFDTKQQYDDAISALESSPSNCNCK